MITEYQLSQLGFSKIIWNDCIPEYYLLLADETGDWFRDGAHRIGVRFNERKGEIETARPFVIIGNSMMYLSHITEPQEVLNLYELLTGKRWKDPFDRVR